MPARKPREPDPPDAAPPLPAPGPTQDELAARDRRAFDDGYRQGQAAARQESAAAIKAAVEGFAAAAAGVAALKPRLRREAEEDVVKLALAIGRRVLHRELSVDPEALLAMIRIALERLDRREIRRLRMHPDDAALAAPHLPLGVAPDASLSRWSAVFETARGDQDWSVETQLQEIERGLLDRLHGRR